MPFEVGSVDLGNHQRHFVVHAEGARIVYDDAPGPSRQRRKLLGNAPSGTEQRNINVRKRIPGQFLCRNLFASKPQLLAHRTSRRQQREPTHRETTFFQRFDHLDADGARRADHGHMRISIHTKATEYNRRPLRVSTHRSGGSGGRAMSAERSKGATSFLSTPPAVVFHQQRNVGLRLLIEPDINGIKTRVLEFELLDVHDEVARAKERIAGKTTCTGMSTDGMIARPSASTKFSRSLWSPSSSCPKVARNAIEHCGCTAGNCCV